MKEILTKLTSGKFILTVIAGIVFYKVSVTLQILPSEAVSSIITAVFMCYFLKKDKNGTS